MKIERINVSEYSRTDEYPGVEARPEGETTLLYGPNVTGKTVTFCALSHAVLNEEDKNKTVSPGHGSSVGVDFTDGSQLHRGSPETTFRTDRHEAVSENVETRMYEVLGDRRILQAYFLHSETDKLPLSRFETDKILDIVRLVTVPDIQDSIAERHEERNELEEEVEDVSEEIDQVETDIERREEDISEAEETRDEAQNLLRLDETGELEAIRDALERQEEGPNELDELLTERQRVQNDLDEAEDRKERLKREMVEPIEQVARSVETSEECPVCEGTVSREKAEDRLDDDLCPLCGLERSIDDYREQFEQAKRAAEDGIEDVQSEIGELEERRDELDEDIEAVRERQPELSAFDENVRHSLEVHDRNLSAVVREARETRDEAEDKISVLREELEELTERRDRLVSQRRQLNGRLNEIKSRISELEGEARQGVEEFTETWRGVLEEMTETIHRSLDITRNEIRVGGSSDRTYGSEDLGTSERHALNLAFAVAVNETVDSERAPLDTLVVDEPFTHFDDDMRPEVLSFVLEDDDRQYIFTSSDSEVYDEVDDDNCVRLEQSDVQWTLDAAGRTEDD